MTKQVVRRQILRRLRQQPQERRLAKSRVITRRLRRLSLYRKARVVMCYAAFDGEVETGWILAQALADGKRVVVPVVRTADKRIFAAEILDPERDLKTAGPFGIPQPKRSARQQIPPKKLDLVIVPGIAFDKHGRRLGRGGGYFDRFLSRLPASVPCVGLAFRFQVVKHLPVESHDRGVSRVMTD